MYVYVYVYIYICVFIYIYVCVCMQYIYIRVRCLLLEFSQIGGPLGSWYHAVVISNNAGSFLVTAKWPLRYSLQPI